jgi:hypothetical protein
MRWALRLVETGADSPARSVEVMEIGRSTNLGDIADLGLTLPEAKQLLGRVQQAVVAAQAREHAALRPNCSSCSRRCHIKDWRLRQIATLFGSVTVRLPRFLCAGCGRIETNVSWPSHCRSTPELNQLHAHLSALLPYRGAIGVLSHLLPVEVRKNPETLRRHTLKVGERLRDAAAVKPAAAAAAIAVTLDSTFIRGRDDGERHLEVRVGDVETAAGARQVFGAVTRAATDITTLIRRNLQAAGQSDHTELTAFTDGCPGLRSILTDAGITKPPILDWFHVAMRLQHAKQAASGLSTDKPEQMQAKAVIVDEVERLRRMPGSRWSGSASICMSSKVRVATSREACHPASCGGRCMKSTTISAARAPGSSTMPSDIAPDCVSELRSPRVRRTSLSIDG